MSIHYENPLVTRYASREIVELFNVTDNTDCIIFREAIDLLKPKLLAVIKALADFADKYKGVPCRGYTHFQTAQPVTVGKRACLWLQDVLTDLEELEHVRKNLKFLGAKMGFDNVWSVTGQAYPQKQDALILNMLSGIATSAMKFAVDIRLLSHEGEVYEPRTEQQVGSSAMAYKFNPMRCERMTSIGRFVITLALNGPMTVAFLAVDGILRIYANVADGLTVNEKRIERHLALDMPFLATENMITAAVKAGGNRQEAHEEVRKLTRELQNMLIEEAGPVLIKKLKKSPVFRNISIGKHLDPKNYIGLAPKQVKMFLKDHIEPVLKNATIEKPTDLDV